MALGASSVERWPSMLGSGTFLYRRPEDQKTRDALQRVQGAVGRGCTAGPSTARLHRAFLGSASPILRPGDQQSARMSPGSA